MDRLKTLILVLVYSVANAMIFLVHGVFWDDLTILNASKEAILEQYVGNGMVWTGYLHCLLQQFPHTVFVYHLLLFIIGLINVCVFRSILKHLPISETTQWYTSLLFAAYPMGAAHMSMICFSYNVGLMLELVAIALFMKSEKFNIFRYVLFFVIQISASMFLPSTIVLIFGVILLTAFLATREEYSLSWDYLKLYTIKTLRLSIYFLPCLVFWAVRKMYFMPIGGYADAGYNSFSLRKTLAYPGSLIQSILNTFEYWLDNASVVFSSILAFVLFLCMAYVLYRSIKLVDKDKQDDKYVPIMISGAFIFVCGITAYNLVGDIPIYNTVEDRHAILLQIASPLIICSVIGLLIRNVKVRQLSYSVITSIFVLGAISQYYIGIQESQKNDAVSQFFANNSLNPGMVFVIDKYDPVKSTRFYTYSGLYYRVTGKQDHCFIVNNSSGADSTLLTLEYNQVDAVIEDTTNFIIVEPERFIYNKQVLFNMKDYYLNRNKYNERLQRTFIVRKQELCTIINNE